MKQESDDIKPTTIREINPNVYKRLFIAVWLGFLYILCVSLVMSSLSGSLFQEKLSKIAKPNKGSDSLFTIHNCIRKGITKQLSTEDELIKVECLPAESKKIINYYDLNDIIIGFDMWQRSSTSTVLLYLRGDDASKKKIVKHLDENIIQLTNTIKSSKSGKSNNVCSEKDPTGNSPKLDTTRRELEFSEITLITTKATRDFITLFSHDKYILSHFNEIKNFNSFFNPISNILKIVTFGTLSDFFWSYPRPILKLNLILSMGILGSLIFVTIEFIGEPKHRLDHSFVMYFFRPFLGMIIALSMYVMVKSGQFTLFNSTEGDLSPFFLSFLGIVSGMLADQAYKKLYSTGETMLDAKPNDRDQENDIDKETIK